LSRGDGSDRRVIFSLDYVGRRLTCLNGAPLRIDDFKGDFHPMFLGIFNRGLGNANCLGTVSIYRVIKPALRIKSRYSKWLTGTESGTDGREGESIVENSPSPGLLTRRSLRQTMFHKN